MLPIPALLALFQLQVSQPREADVVLAGLWRFRAGDNAAWAAPAFNDASWDSVSVPRAWPATAVGGGYGWYRLHLALTGVPRQPIGVWLSSVATAFEVYIDGRLVGGWGGLPPSYRPRSVIPLVVAFPPDRQVEGPHVIAVRVYSQERVGGIVGPVRIGPLLELHRDAQRPDLYLSGVAMLLLGIALVQVFFWLRRQHAREHVAIVAVCVFLAMFFVVWMPAVRTALEPYVSWVRLYYAAAAAAAAACCYAFHRIFELDRGERVVVALGLAYLVQVPLFLGLQGWDALRLVGSWVLYPTLAVGAALTLGLAAQQMRQGAGQARVLLGGVTLLALTVVYDVVMDWGQVPVRPAFPWLTLVGSVAFVAGLVLTTAERFVESETAALYDRLTGLYRREVVLDALSREIRRAARMHQPLAVIMLDVDRFKQVNDTLGHQAGDRVLGEIGRRMVEAGRAVDWLGRYGGEEFVGVLASTDVQGAALAAERLRSAVAALPIATGRTTRTVTLSAGVAAYDGGAEWPTTEQIVGAADAALYRAKSAGRNCVMS
jgi:diguanylate cyclase (GGDEF)-like protein